MIAHWELWLYPELRRIDKALHPEALAKARDGAFDMVEWVGLAVALVVVVSLTRYSSAGFDMAERFSAVLVNFAVAVPLLLLFCGPFYVRRVRRGLRTYIKEHPSKVSDETS